LQEEICQESAVSPLFQVVSNLSNMT